MNDLRFIDTHAHLTSDDFAGKLAGVLDRSRQVGVVNWITVGTDLDDSKRAVELAGETEGMFCTVGVHPHEAEKQSRELAGFMKELVELGGEHVKALGEMGLDYYYDFSPRKAQQTIFCEQLELAKKLGLPVVIHCRDAFDDGIAILDEWGWPEACPVVFHCYTGNKKQAGQLLDRGGLLSFTGVITFRKSVEVQEAAVYAPLDRIMLETDCPYLSPEPKRSVRPNEPALMLHTAAKLAELREVGLQEIAQAVWENSRQFYRIGNDGVED